MTTVAPIRDQRISYFWRFLTWLVMLFAPLRGGLLLCVAVPTLLATLYQGLIASDIYVSESAFSIRQEKSTGGLTELGMAIPALQGAGQQDLLTVNTYILSRSMVDELDKKLDLQAIYRHADADRLARLKIDANQEELLNYYRSRVLIHYDERAQISTLNVQAFTSEDAKLLNETILELAETFVNQLSAAMREDSISFARSQVTMAEKEMISANKALSGFREENRNFDPALASQGVGSLLLGLETKIAEKRAELDAARGTMTSRNQNLRNLEREVAALERQVTSQNRRLTGGTSDTLGRQLENFTSVSLLQDFAVKRYGLALVSLEAAQAEAARKNIYLARIVAPSLPDIATEPRRFYRVMSVFFLTLAGYAMLLLIAASIGDHIRK